MTRLRFNPTLLKVVVIEKIRMEHVFLQIVRVSLVRIIAQMLHTRNHLPIFKSM